MIYVYDAIFQSGAIESCYKQQFDGIDFCIGSRFSTGPGQNYFLWTVRSDLHHITYTGAMM